MSGEEFYKRLPLIDDLVLNYQVSPDVAFALWRPTYASAIQSKYEELRKSDRREKQETNSQSSKVARYIEASNAVMSPVMELVSPLNPPKIWDEIGIQFYTTFWSLTMYDLQVPNSAYDKQRSSLKAQLNAIDDNKDLAQSSSKKKKEKDRCLALMDKMAEEEKRQEEHVKLVINRLKQEKDLWFSLKTVPKQSMITSVLQLCLFPRCCLTTIDAVYCAKFLHILHHLKTPNFSSLICYDRIFTEASWAISSCTESEAHRFGHFLCTVLDDIMRWHSDKHIFEKECANFPGFVTVFRVPKSDLSAPPADSLDFENYRHVVHKWHYSLCVSTANNIDSKDYMQIRNALIVLTKMLPHFPRVIRFGNALDRRVDRLCQEEKEKRPDIYALAMGYIGQLKQKKKTWIEESEFHSIAKKQAPSRTSESSDTKPQPESKTTEKMENGTSLHTPDKRDVKETSLSASKDKKIVRSTSKQDQRESKDPKENKESKDSKPRENLDKSDSKEKNESVKESSKERKSKVKENGKEITANKAGGKESKPKEKEAKPKEAKTRPASKDKDIKEKEKRHKEKKEDKIPKEEKPSKEEKEQSRKEEKERRKEDKERARQMAEGRERLAQEAADRDRSKEERDRIKEEKREAREAKAAEKHREKERLKREKEALRDSDKDYYEHDKEKDRMRDHRDENDDRGSRRHSAEPSPKQAEDRDVKRRKLEVKDSAHHSTDYWDKPHKSPGHDRAERIDYESPREREREKRERKRVSLDRSTDDREYAHLESKRYRADEPPDKQNGEPRSESKDRHRSRSAERERERIKEMTEYTDNHVPKSGRKSSPDKLEKERRKADKHGSKKSSKHH